MRQSEYKRVDYYLIDDLLYGRRKSHTGYCKRFCE